MKMRKFEKGFFKKWANPGLFFVYFRLFKQTIQFLQQINVKNVHPVYIARIRTHIPLEHESPPITTRLRLPPKAWTWFALILDRFFPNFEIVWKWNKIGHDVKVKNKWGMLEIKKKVTKIFRLVKTEKSYFFKFVYLDFLLKRFITQATDNTKLSKIEGLVLEKS